MTKKKVKVVGKVIGDKANHPNANGVSGSKSSTKGSPWVHLVITALSFLAGVVSPPMRYYILLRNDVGPNRKLVLATPENSKSETAIIGASSRSCSFDSEELVGFLSDEHVPGQHTLCFTDDDVVIFRNSKPTMNFKVKAGGSWADLKTELESSLALPDRRYPVQAWALFTKDGERVVDEDYKGSSGYDIRIAKKIRESGVLILFEGGQWIWPGISKGFKREIQLDFVPTKGYNAIEKRNATLITLSLHPLVLSVEGFLSEDECNYIQDTASPKMQYSGVTLMDKDKGRPASDFRTSQSAFLGGEPSKVIDRIDLRTASLVRIPQSHQEYVQVLRYGYTEKYNAHMDFFDPRSYKNDPQTMQMIENGKKNRLATVFWYLSDVPKGGETIFPRVDKGPHPFNTADCSVGLKVKPERGKVIIFYSMTPEGELDEYSLHGACPVEEGIKWAANKWVWNKPTGFYPM